MSNLSRIAIATAFVAGLGSLAQAQSRERLPSAVSDHGLTEGRSAYVERVPQPNAPVSASMSHTVMGLSVPR